MKHLKQEFDKLSIKEFLAYSLAIASTVAGFVLLFIGVYIPPEGQIHESVLTAFGIILVFAGSLLGISMHYENEAKKFKDSISRYVAETVGKHKSEVSSDNAT